MKLEGVISLVNHMEYAVRMDQFPSLEQEAFFGILMSDKPRAHGLDIPTGELMYGCWKGIFLYVGREAESAEEAAPEWELLKVEIIYAFLTFTLPAWFQTRILLMYEDLLPLGCPGQYMAEIIKRKFEDIPWSHELNLFSCNSSEMEYLISTGRFLLPKSSSFKPTNINIKEPTITSTTTYSNSHKDAVKNMDAEVKSCNNCGKYSLEMKRCARCKKIKYCDGNCQKSDWKIHQKKCLAEK